MKLTMFKILLLNGPNLNLLGTREPEYYGVATLQDIIDRMVGQARDSCELQAFQSNAEHELVERVQAAAGGETDFIIINPAALTHTSVCLRDALQAIGIPFIELHLSNVHAREEFRKQSYFSDIAVGVISGLGPIGYELALQAAVRYLEEHK
jgi:3-dehydroquinate dehydratase-2